MKRNIISKGILLLITWVAGSLLPVSAQAGSYTVDLVYDADGQLVRAVEGAFTAMEYFYDDNGNLLEVVPYLFATGYFRDGTWTLDKNGDRSFAMPGDLICTFGQAGDMPVTGDWDANGYTNIGVFYGGTWDLDVDGDCVWDQAMVYDRRYTFGQSGDIPVTGDWDGDGITDLGVYRAGTWILDTNGNYIVDAGDETFTYTYAAGELPVAGDWDGDGKAEVGVVTTAGDWWLDIDSDRNISGDYPIHFTGDVGLHYFVGDWYSDGATDIGLTRHYNRGGRKWAFDFNLDGTGDAVNGTPSGTHLSTDIPVAGRW